MSIIRTSKREDPFARVSKKMLVDKRLSWRAKGILSYLLGQPDNWETRTEDLVRNSTDGITAIYSAMKELRECGYADLETVRTGQRIEAKRWVIRDVPLDLGSLSQASLSQGNLGRNKNDKQTRMMKKWDDSASRSSFGINGSPQPKHEHSIVLTKRFFKVLGRHHLLDGRADLPNGDSPQSKKRCDHTRGKWVEATDSLLERLDGDHERVLEVLEWYDTNLNKPYTPHCEAMTTFCQSYFKIEKAMHRDNGTTLGTPESRISVEECED